jgi:TorA maturation chaperone TorD
MDLMGVPTKELRSFLLRRKIPMNNCTEKTDLVEILLSTSNNLHYRKEQAERQRHLVELEVKYARDTIS